MLNRQLKYFLHLYFSFMGNILLKNCMTNPTLVSRNTRSKSFLSVKGDDFISNNFEILLQFSYSEKRRNSKVISYRYSNCNKQILPVNLLPTYNSIVNIIFYNIKDLMISLNHV